MRVAAKTMAEVFVNLALDSTSHWEWLYRLALQSLITIEAGAGFYKCVKAPHAAALMIHAAAR